MSNYLFVYFTDSKEPGEQVYFALSEDGLNFQDLNDQAPVLISELGTKGVRDPFILRDEANQKFYIIATDLKITAGLGWEQAATRGSRNMLVWESTDLVHWSEPWSVTLAPTEAGNLWAPEAIFDQQQQEFLVFWASHTQQKHKIYASYTKNFRQFSEPFVFIERPADVIDTTIIYASGSYYRFSKDETSSRILMEAGESLTGVFQEVNSPFLSQLTGVEGPQIYQLPEQQGWCLIVDRFKEEEGYLPLICQDLATGAFEVAADFDFGGLKKRHGSVLELTAEEAQYLRKFYQQKNPVIDGLYADPDLVKFEDTYYIYPTTDGFNEWSGSNFSVFASLTLEHFSEKQEILELTSDQVPWAQGAAWAPCITEKDGRYYYYFCGKRHDGRPCIGMACSSQPMGPYTAMPEPVLTPELVAENKVKVTQVIDPSIYCEDGHYYLLFGNGHGGICELSEDMRSVKPNSFHQYEGLADFREAVEVFKKDGRYHFTWSCEDTGDENYHVNYGVADSLYGTVAFQYPLLCKNTLKGILGTGHHSIFCEPDTQEYFIAYHRFASPIADYQGKNGFHREVCISPLVFDEAGLLRKVIV